MKSNNKANQCNIYTFKSKTELLILIQINKDKKYSKFIKRKLL